LPILSLRLLAGWFFLFLLFFFFLFFLRGRFLCRRRLVGGRRRRPGLRMLSRWHGRFRCWLSPVGLRAIRFRTIRLSRGRAVLLRRRSGPIHLVVVVLRTIILGAILLRWFVLRRIIFRTGGRLRRTNRSRLIWHRPVLSRLIRRWLTWRRPVRSGLVRPIHRLAGGLIRRLIRTVWRLVRGLSGAGDSRVGMSGGGSCRFAGRRLLHHGARRGCGTQGLQLAPRDGLSGIGG
jgi:hypothetical protein